MAGHDGDSPAGLFDSGGKLTSTALHVNGVGVDLPATMRQVATAQNAPLIDLTARSKALVEGLGPSASAKIYLTAATDGVTCDKSASS
ncbi:hypothetical protein [Nonomuraea sp. NPDC050786]|uniref:hypothetical protein n=1 Tax=Nonomuraea sp. NPDC050786 TaxID=3154840 RepID=UPI0033F24CD6